MGYGIKRGIEIAIHSARVYLSNLPHDHLILKLDFKNAFNTIRRDKMLLAVKDLAPSLLPFVHSVYCSPSSLFWGTEVIQSSEGVQQGDPLGPLLFCLTIHNMCSQLKSELRMFYLDDGTLGGTLTDVLKDLQLITKEAHSLGLQLNYGKSEIISNNTTIIQAMLTAVPGLQVTEPKCTTLLGTPLGDIASISAAICAKIVFLKKMGERLCNLDAHDALLLLRHSFAIPKLLNILRTSPCFLSEKLADFDDLLRFILSSTLNISLGINDPAWTQAQLPIKLGGLGIRSACQLAPSAFLASAAGTSDTLKSMLPASLHNASIPDVESALSHWSQGNNTAPPVPPASCFQKAWDLPKMQLVAQGLLASADSPSSRARLLAASTPESGKWLNAFPISSIGLRMDNSTIRIAVGLRLGVPLCHSHTCRHCGSHVNDLATHGLSCRWSEGRHSRHSSLNDIIHRALSAAKIPARLEPSGVARSDGKRPDGISMVPWKEGKLLVWDATCRDTLAPSYLSTAERGPGLVAAEAESQKRKKYSSLGAKYFFVPIACESLGVFGAETLSFLKDLGHRLHKTTGDSQSYQFLLQCLSVAIQRGNSTSVLGTLSSFDGLDDF